MQACSVMIALLALLFAPVLPAAAQPLASPKGDHDHPGLDHSNLDEVSEIGVASLENVTRYLWRLFQARFPGLEEVELKRGFAGSVEGCIYRGEVNGVTPLGLAA